MIFQDSLVGLVSFKVSSSYCHREFYLTTVPSGSGLPIDSLRIIKINIVFVLNSIQVSFMVLFPWFCLFCFSFFNGLLWFYFVCSSVVPFIQRERRSIHYRFSYPVCEMLIQAARLNIWCYELSLIQSQWEFSSFFSPHLAQMGNIINVSALRKMKLLMEVPQRIYYTAASLICGWWPIALEKKEKK